MNSAKLSRLLAAADAEGAPLIARMYELHSAEELAAEHAPRPDALSLAPAPVPLPQPLSQPPSQPPAMAATEPLLEGGLPFVGEVLAHTPGVSIIVRRTLSLAEDRHLADHAFVHALGIKPLSACMPVLPLTMSLEVLAEAAACLAPGIGLLGFENVKATRWIELADSDSLALKISAQIAGVDAAQGVCRVHAEIHIPGHGAPVITATVLFAAQYRVDLALSFTEFSQPRRLPLTGEDIYAQRHMFHGPSFHCLSGDIVVSERGASTELLVRSAESLFASVRHPQLLIDPALLDGVGQCIGVWAMQRERYVFPIGIAKLELYRPTPPAGTRVPLRIEITRDEAKTLYADAEIGDGQGGVWLRVRDWAHWKFRWPRALVDFRRAPARRSLCTHLALPGLPPAAVCCWLSPMEVAGFDATLLARHFLHMDEMTGFGAKAEQSRRQQHWLLGRIAAKDAARTWLAGRDGVQEMRHPAALVVDSAANGQPTLQPIADAVAMPNISIAHCEGRAVAIASDMAIGIDIEPVAGREAGFVNSFCSPVEIGLLEAVAGGDGALLGEWITRLWCAKEAAGKCLGTGVAAGPRRFEAVVIDAAAGRIEIQAPEHSQPIGVCTVREGDFIVAWAAR